MCTTSASGLGDATTHFDGRIRITVAFSQPIALPENMSYWYLLKKLANYRPGENDNKRPRSRWSGLVARGGDGYDKGEVEGGIGRSCTEVETRFHYNPKLGGAAEDKEFNLECNWPELLSEAFAEAADKICGPGHGVELRLERGGADGEAEGGAAESMLLLRYAPSQTCAGTGAGGQCTMGGGPRPAAVDRRGRRGRQVQRPADGPQA